MLFIKNRLKTIDKRIIQLNKRDNKIILEFITNFEDNKNEFYHVIKVVDRCNRVIYSKEIEDKPSYYISDLMDKYGDKVELEFYNIVNNQKIKQF